MKTKTAKKRSAAELLQTENKSREGGRARYKLADAQLKEVTQRMRDGELKLGEWKLCPDGKERRLIDKYETTDRVGAGLGVNRFEVETREAV